jgi:hypothetical protein
VSTGATTSVEASATPSTTSSGDLAATGPTEWTWALGLIALGLIVLGYLAVSGTWKPGRKTPS